MSRPSTRYNGVRRMNHLLKSSTTDTSATPSKSPSSGETYSSVNACTDSTSPSASPWTNEAKISDVVQDVVRSMRIDEDSSAKIARTETKLKWIDDCVNSVIRSSTVSSPVVKPLIVKHVRAFMRSPSKVVGQHQERQRTEPEKVLQPLDNENNDDDEEEENMGSPPKLTAIRDRRIRKRRKRRFLFSFTRRQPRRRPNGLKAALALSTDGDGATSLPRRRRRPKVQAPPEVSPMDTTAPIPPPTTPSIVATIEEAKKTDDPLVTNQVHESVFAPEQCDLVKASKLRRKLDDAQRETTNGNNDRPGSSSSSSVRRCWHSTLNEKLFPRFANADKNDELGRANQWSVEEVTDFVQSLPSCPPTVAAKFRQEQIDGEAFMLLTQHDIVKLMNIRLGPAVKIYNAIMFLKHRRLNGTK